LLLATDKQKRTSAQSRRVERPRIITETMGLG